MFGCIIGAEDLGLDAQEDGEDVGFVGLPFRWGATAAVGAEYIQNY